MLAVAIRLSRCKVAACKAPFQKQRPFQTWCSPECGTAIALLARAKTERIDLRASKARAKIERVEFRARKLAAKPRAWWLKRAERAFNEWIRERDRLLPCVSCLLHKNTYDAGHYMTVGHAPELRFDEANVHKQCVQCNHDKHGNTVPYRIELKRRIGEPEVDRLEGPNHAKKYTIADLQLIHDTCRAKTKALKQLREITP